MTTKGGITAVGGVLAGHWTSDGGTTGVTAVLFPHGARGGVHVPGSATGTRELGPLDPSHLAGDIHGICLAGGSAFGLAAADGVMDVIADRGLGFDSGHGRVPIVPAAILFDLHSGSVRPDRAAGRLAAEAASAAPLAIGRVGAGAGARVGLASGSSAPGGIGTADEAVDAWTVGTVVAVNAVGSVWDGHRWVAGGPVTGHPLLSAGDWRGQTTLVIVATDAPLDRARCSVVARMASAGMARTLYPAFTPFDGDIVFACSTGTGEPPDTLALLKIGDAAARAVARAIIAAVG